MMNPRLSICIPTYNRVSYLPTAIQSVLSQQEERIEIVISDNGSTDETQAVLAPYLEKYPNILYSRHPVNQGADRNYMRVISLARGEYCWFLGSDDVLEPGSIAKILKAIETDPELSGLSVNVRAYDFKLTKPVYVQPPTIYRENQTFSDWKRCFEGLFTYWGYISGQVFKRKLWERALGQLEPERFLNAYVHVYIIGKMVQLAPRWIYFHEQLVGWRSGNDSFLSNGFFQRFELDASGYPDIARELCASDLTVATRIVSKLLSTHIRCHVIAMTFRPDKNSLKPRMWNTCFRLYRSYAAFWTGLFWWFLIPTPLMSCLRFVHRKLRKI